MRIDIFHDTACPWCRIGKQQLFAALAQWSGEAVEIHWHPFLLDDTIPEEGVPFRPFMENRKGIDPQELDRLFHFAQQAGAAAGVKLNFETIPLAVNTTLSHGLISLAPTAVKAAVVEAVYQAYFEDGQNIGEINTLVALGEAAGMDGIWLRYQLQEDALRQQVIREAAAARQRGITSVPFFIFDNRVSISGSQSVKIFQQTLDQLARIQALELNS